MFSTYFTRWFSVFLLLLTISIYVSDTVYCDSYNCPYGYALIDDADHEECEYGKCEKSKCCDKVCSSYDPKYYEPVDDSDTTVCKDSKCTKEECCKKGETTLENTLR